VPPVVYQDPSQKTNGLAITSMICGIVGVVVCCLWFLAGPAAVITGFIARGQIAKGQGKGSGMAMTGLILGFVAIAIGVIALILNGTGALVEWTDSLS